MQLRHLHDGKSSNSFELVSIDDNNTYALGASSSSSSNTGSTDHPSSTSTSPHRSPRQKKRGCNCQLSPRGRLCALAGYLLISGVSSLYFCLVQAGLDNIQICQSIASCLFFSTQGWPAMGEQSVDLLIMSYISGVVSVTGALLGSFGLFAAYKESASKVRIFAKAWWIMIGIFIGSTVLTLMLTVVHKDRFLNQCSIEHDTIWGTNECGAMYVAALVGSVFGCLIGVAMIWCYGEDVVKYSLQLETVKEKSRQADGRY